MISETKIWIVLIIGKMTLDVLQASYGIDATEQSRNLTDDLSSYGCNTTLPTFSSCNKNHEEITEINKNFFSMCIVSAVLGFIGFISTIISACFLYKNIERQFTFYVYSATIVLPVIILILTAEVLIESAEIDIHHKSNLDQRIIDSFTLARNAIINILIPCGVYVGGVVIAVVCALLCFT